MEINPVVCNILSSFAVDDSSYRILEKEFLFYSSLYGLIRIIEPYFMI